ncbi:hypothetical protein WT63_09210 [Burkholderia anthina]|nr:hypothetical protein WT63_09210 [Burkholderia anthina]
MLVQPLDVDLDVVQCPQFLHQLVGQRQQFRLKCADHLAERLFQLRDVHELAFLLGQRQQLDLTLDDLRLRALGNQIDTSAARATRGHLA